MHNSVFSVCIKAYLCCMWYCNEEDPPGLCLNQERNLNVTIMLYSFNSIRANLFMAKKPYFSNPSIKNHTGFSKRKQPSLA